jgi:type IV pilus assembly protein PilC
VPEFQCRLGAPDGSVVEQRRLAVSAESLAHELEGEGFHVFSIAAPRMRFRVPFLSRREKVSGKDFTVFNTQLRTLLRAGLPLAQSLDLLRSQQPNAHFRALLDKVHQQITTGVSLSDAFLSLGDIFPRLYANSLRAGERSGDLEGVLQRYIEYQRLVESVRKKIVTALTYPAVLVMMSVSLVVLLMWKVIPSFTDFYAGFGAELPLPTTIVINTAEFVQKRFLLLFAGVVGLLMGVRFWYRTPRGRMAVDRWKLKIPVLGGLAHLFALSQFSRSLSILLSGGTPMVPALETAATSVGNAYVSDEILACVPSVREGRAVSETLEETGLMSELAVAMMRVGESTGELPAMLTNTSEFFDDEIEFSLSRVVTLIEPAILVFMGLVVAGLLLAVYYPLLTLVTKMN